MTLHRHPDVRVLGQDTVFQGRVFDLIRQRLRLPSGLEQDLDLIEHPGAVCVLAVDDQGRILVVRQYRAAASGWTLELPAGRLDPGEEPLEAAARELEEETGYRADSVTHLLTFFPAVGFASERIHMFEAKGLETVEGGGLACDADEEIEVQWIAPADLIASDPLDSKTLIAALLIQGKQS